MTGGYIKLHRALLNHPLVTQCSPVTLRVWILILLRANWKPYIAITDKGEELMPAGSFLFSQRKLAEQFGVSHQQLRDSLETLEKRTHCITLRRTHRASCVIVCNWSTYQGADEEENTVKNTGKNNRGTQEEHRRNTGGTLEEEVKKEIREESNNHTDSATPTESWRVVAFAAFWEIVWAKIGRTAAEKAWKKAATTPEVAERIRLSAIERGPALLQHARLHAHSVIHPSTWLNQGRWMDETQSLAMDLIPVQRNGTTATFSQQKEQRRADLFAEMMEPHLAAKIHTA